MEKEKMNRQVSGIMLALLFVGMLTSAFDVQPVEASETIYIRADGNIYPPTLRIQRYGDVYIFTNNILGSIVVERNNTIIDGNGYTLQDSGSGHGFELININNVIIKNTIINGYNHGIYLHASINIAITGNTIIKNNWDGIEILLSDNNRVSGNIITTNAGEGIRLAWSSKNTISGNNITKNYNGIRFQESFNNLIYHNNIFKNTNQVHSYISNNIWDNRCEGNYWSDYKGTDADEDGIGDTPYVIDENNQDNYPLMAPYDIRPVKLEPRWTVDDDGPADFHTIQAAINAASDGDTIFVKEGAYYEYVVVNKSVSLIGENRETTIIDGNFTGIIVRVVASSVTIKGFKIWMARHAGILIKGHNNTITHNSISYITYPFDGTSVGISLRRSCKNFIGYNTISRTDRAITLDKSSNENTISYNLMTNDSYGIGLAGNCHFNLITNNIISNLRLAGIYLVQQSSINYIIGNTISNCRGGILFELSDGNIIYHNNFIDNAKGVSKCYGSNNIWDNGYPSGGNYWSNYNGTDYNEDGIGDTPYVINENNQDKYPLMNSYIGPEKMRVLYYELLEKYNDILTIRNLLYVFIATTIIFIATTVYLAIRKPKTCMHALFLSGNP